jgi:hypothetical protein
MAAGSSLFSQRVQALFPLLIAVVAVVGISLLGDLTVGMLPVRAGDVQWRFVVFGGVLGLLPQVAILLLIADGIAILGGIRGALRGASLIALIMAGLVIVLLPFFLLDFLTFRRMIPEANKHRTDMTTLKTALFGGWFALMFIWLGIRGWQVGKKEEQVKRAEGEGLIVGQA